MRHAWVHNLYLVSEVDLAVAEGEAGMRGHMSFLKASALGGSSSALLNALDVMWKRNGESEKHQYERVYTGCQCTLTLLTIC